MLWVSAPSISPLDNNYLIRACQNYLLSTVFPSLKVVSLPPCFCFSKTFHPLLWIKEPEREEKMKRQGRRQTCVCHVCTFIFSSCADVCVNIGGGGVWSREPLCPFIAEEWRLFTHAVGVRALTSISSLWLVKMQFWTCSRLVNVWQGGRRGAKLKTMIALMNDVDLLVSHFCQLMSAKRWNVARFNHKAILLLNETLETFRAERWFSGGRVVCTRLRI